MSLCNLQNTHRCVQLKTVVNNIYIFIGRKSQYGKQCYFRCWERSVASLWELDSHLLWQDPNELCLHLSSKHLWPAYPACPACLFCLPLSGLWFPTYVCSSLASWQPTKLCFDSNSSLSITPYWLEILIQWLQGLSIELSPSWTLPRCSRVSASCCKLYWHIVLIFVFS